MDYDYELPHKFDGPKVFAFKCKSSPGNGVDLAQSAEMVAGKVAGAFNFKHKSELKKKFDGEHSLKFTSTNKDYELQYTLSPEALNKDGVEGQLEVKAKCLPATNGWEGSAEFKAGGFELGPIKPWTELQLETNQDKEHTL